MREYRITAQGILSLRKENADEQPTAEMRGLPGETVYAQTSPDKGICPSAVVAVVHLLDSSVRMMFGDGLRVAESTRLSRSGHFMELASEENNWSVLVELVQSGE